MLNVPLTLAAGWILSYCVHTPQGRELAKKAMAEAMKHMGTAEKGIASALRKTPKPKKEGTA